MRGILCCGWIATALLSAPVRAQQGETGADLVLPVGPGAAEVTPSQLLARVAARLDRPLTADAEAFCLRGSQGFAPARLKALDELDGLLSRAQAQAAALDEAAALSSLALAARVGAQLLDLPGIASWHAEIEMRTGLVAAQAGRLQLADAALRRAASLDLDRRLMAAEATPEVVKLADRIWQQTRSAPEGRVRVDADAPGAQVFLDDVPVGTAPLTVTARTGRHILRIEARGRLAYGTLVDLMEGQRPPIHVRMAPDPRLQLAADLRAAARDGDVLSVRGALRALVDDGATAGAVWLAQVGRRPGRMLLRGCDADGCAEVQVFAERGTGPVGLVLAGEAATRWLDESAPVAAAEDGTGGGVPGWAIWGGAAVATALTAVLTAVLSEGRPPPRRELTIVVDPGDAAQ